MMVYLFLLWKHKRKRAQLKEERSGDSREKFIESYKPHPDGETVAGAVYDAIQRDYLRTNLPIRSDDDIEETLDIAAEDFDELVETTLSRFNIPLNEALEKQDRLPVRTVDDLITLILEFRNGTKEKVV